MTDTLLPPATADAMPPRAMSNRMRIGWMLIALLPEAVLQVVHDPNDRLWMLIGALTFAIAIDVAVSFLRKRPASLRRDPDVLLIAALIALWLPPSTPLWALASAALVAILLVHVFDGRQSGSPFHPTMVGCPLALLLFPHAANQPMNSTMSIWIGVAYALAGIALMLGRCIRWQVPLAMLASAALCYLIALIASDDQHIAVSPLALLPSLMLTAFFVATDPASSCMLPRARWRFGMGIGVLAMLAVVAARSETQALLGIAGAALLMNAAAPWIDKISERPSPALQRTDANNR